jgi:hypothetical protein
MTKGDYREMGGASLFFDVLLNKTRPPVGVIVNHLRGQDRQGNKPTLLGDLRDLFAPMPATTAAELVANPNSANIFVAMIADELGSNTNTYPDSAYSKVKKFIEDSSQSLFKKSAGDLTPREYDTIVNSPGYKAIEIEYKQTRRQGPARFQQSAEVFAAGQRIYSALPENTRNKLFDYGITTIGIDDSIKGLSLNEERFKDYEQNTLAEISKIKVEGMSEKSIKDAITKAKDLARTKTLAKFMTDQELGQAIAGTATADGQSIKVSEMGNFQALSAERNRRNKLKQGSIKQ